MVSKPNYFFSCTACNKPPKTTFKWVVQLLLFCTTLFSLYAFTRTEPFALAPHIIAATEQQFGPDAVKRLTQWQRLINDGRGDSDWQKLHLANNFANKQVSYAADKDHWQQDDYWATPLQSLQTAAGDCEDYAVLKYFTLRAMGIDDDKLKLMYVRALNWDEPHMVLTYTAAPGSYPLVLDNMNTAILPANKRTDLRPVFAFNASGAWFAKAQGLGNKMNDNATVPNWKQLLERIEHDK